MNTETVKLRRVGLYNRKQFLDLCQQLKDAGHDLSIDRNAGTAIVTVDGVVHFRAFELQKDFWNVSASTELMQPI